jgi:hypothetical protein
MTKWSQLPDYDKTLIKQMAILGGIFGGVIGFLIGGLL